MREFVKVLPLGLLLPLVIGAGSVKPDELISNYAIWAHWLGFSHVPGWISNPAADNRIILGSFGAAIIYAFVIWTIPVIKENRAHPGSDKLKNHFLLVVFLFSSAALVTAIWRFVPPPPIKIALPPAPQTSPPPPPPWVSNEEIERAKKAGRLLIPFSPEELSLMNYYKGPDGTQAYVGKWIKIHNKFDSVQRFVETDKREYLVVRIQELRLTIFVFDSKKWADRILTLRPGAMIDGLCQLTAYDGKPYEITSVKVAGMSCEPD
jgi:hypothetical protein